MQKERNLIKELFSRVRQYKAKTVATPIFMVLEVLMEVLIPAIMAQIIDVGVAEMDMNYILLMSAFLILTALLSLFLTAALRLRLLCCFIDEDAETQRGEFT